MRLRRRTGFRGAILRIMGMYAHGGEDIFVALGNFDSHAIVFDRTDRAD